MQTTTRTGWALALLLLSNCRSEQVAFSFRQAPTTTASGISVPITSLPLTSATLSDTAARSASPRTQTTAPVRASGAATAEKRPSSDNRGQLWRAQRHQEATALARPQTPLRHDTLHILLGALLVVGGVVAGLALGGWLGLGVGAVVVLLGYYFVVLGIGGKHAWLEIFQEFFNM